MNVMTVTFLNLFRFSNYKENSSMEQVGELTHEKSDLPRLGATEPRFKCSRKHNVQPLAESRDCHEERVHVGVSYNFSRVIAKGGTYGVAELDLNR